MLNYVNAVFNGFNASSEKKVLFGHVVDSPDSISESSLEQKTKCSCPAENHRFVSFSSTNFSMTWPLTAFSQCLCYNWEIPGRGLPEAFRL